MSSRGASASPTKPGAARPRARAASPAQAPKPIGLLVMGMHRSGTSAVARTLNLLGAALPEDLLGPSANNPMGHWEPRKTYELHNRLLEEIDARWDDWTPIAPEWFSSPTAERYAYLLAEFLAEEFQDKPLFVLKDPRICRLAPLWRRAFELAGCDPRVVFPIRNPLDVTASLTKRNGMPQSKGMMLWLRYVADAEIASRDLPRCFLRYDDLLADWRTATGRIAERLHFVWPRETLKSAREVDEFLSPEHRHNAADLEDLGKAGVHPWVASAYQALHLLIDDPGAPAATSALDAIRIGLDQAATAFWPVVTDELGAAHAKAEELRLRTKAERNEAQREVERLKAELAQHIGGEVEEVERLKAELAQHIGGEVEEVERLKAELAQHLSEEVQGEQLRSRIETDAEQLRSQLQMAQSALRDRSDEVQRLSGELDAAQTALKEETQHLRAEHAAAVEQLQAEAGRWRDAALKVADEVGAKARAAVDEARQQLVAVEAKRLDALEELARNREDMAELRAAKQGLERQDERLASELVTAQSELAAAQEELRRTRKDAKSQRRAREVEVSALQADNARLAEERAAAKTRVLELKREREILRAQIDGLTERAHAAEAARERLLGSASWRVTQPLRRLTALQQRLGRSPRTRSQKV